MHLDIIVIGFTGMLHPSSRGELACASYETSSRAYIAGEIVVDLMVVLRDSRRV